MGRAKDPRKEAARLAGEITYMGSSCLYNHDGLRYVAGGKCYHCHKERSPGYAATYRKTDNGKHYQRDYRRKYVADPKNKERIAAIQHKYYVNKFFDGDEEAFKAFKIAKEERRQVLIAHRAEVKLRRDLREKG